MPESLTSRIVLHVSATSEISPPLDTTIEQLALDVTNNFTNGTGTNQANKLFSVQATTHSDTFDINMKTLETSDAGSSFTGGNDNLKQPYALTKVKAIMVQNLATGGQTLVIGQYPGTPWTAIFNGGDDALILNAGATLLLVAPSADGYSVDAVNNILRITTAGTVTFNVVVIGAQ